MSSNKKKVSTKYNLYYNVNLPRTLSLKLTEYAFKIVDFSTLHCTETMSGLFCYKPMCTEKYATSLKIR